MRSSHTTNIATTITGGGARVRVGAEREVWLGAKGAVPGGEHRHRH